MSEKMFNTRIIHKHDTEVNWNKAVNFIPMQGEIIVYDIDENYNYERIKIGDGQTVVADLPFTVEDVAVLRSEIEEEEALEILMDMNLVAPVMADDGSVYVDENGAMYSL